MRLSDLTAMIARLAQDAGGILAPEDSAAALRAAVERYGMDQPRRFVADLPIADDGLDLPEDWEAGFSAVAGLEYPIGQRPPALLPNEGYYPYAAPDGDRLMFAPGYGGTGAARLTYTRRHAYDADADACTVPDQHLEAVAAWAAAVLCEQLATYYAGNSEPTIQADRVDYTSPARQYQKRAESLRKRYFDELGIDPRRNVAACAVATPVAKNSVGGPRLTHPLRPWRRG